MPDLPGSVSVSQGPLTAYPGDKAYGYTAQGDTVRGQGLQSARHAHTWAHIHAQHCELSHTRVERYHLPCRLVTVGTMEPPFLNPGHIRRRHRHASFCSCSQAHVHTSELLWRRLHNRRSLFIRPPLPPPHASGRPVTWPAHDVSTLIFKYQPDGGPLVAVQRWLYPGR